MRVRTGRFLRGSKVGHKMDTSKAGYVTSRQSRFTWTGALRPLRDARLCLCRRFRPSPCPTHYDGRLATMPSADFCSNTPTVSRCRAAKVVSGSGGDSRGAPPGPQSGSHDHVRPHGVQISADKSMNFPYTTAAFTLPRDTGGLHHVVLTRPGTEPSMRFLSVGSYVCARASCRQHFAVGLSFMGVFA